MIGRFPLPLHLVTGNHDNRDALLKVFGGTGHVGGGERAHYSVDYPAATVVALAEVISRHPQVARVLAGHIHRPIVAGFAGTMLTIAPSTYRQSALCLRADQPLTYVPEPTGFLLHQQTPTGYITHTVQVSHAGASEGGF